jgi:hypothetical protein
MKKKRTAIITLIVLVISSLLTVVAKTISKAKKIAKHDFKKYSSECHDDLQ